MFGSSQRSTLISGVLHALAIAVVLLLTAVKPGPIAKLLTHDTTIFVPHTYHAIVTSGGGGGGGQHSATPPTRGVLPREARRVFTPPLIPTNIENVQLPMAPSILNTAETATPVYQIGIPFGALGPPSPGPGAKGGMGGTDGTGVGSKGGPGGGDGDNPVGSGGAHPKKMTMPVVLSQNEPEYSEDARKAKLQGTVDLRIVVGADGRVAKVEVIRGLGLGLDEKAAEAVKQWRFRPATADGKPIAASALVEVTFRLL